MNEETNGMKTVLITGGTGLVGQNLSEKLRNKGYTVNLLSRKKTENTFVWRPEEGEIDPMAFQNLEAIIHLSGTTISKRWTIPYKKELYDSRIKTAGLLYDYTRKYAPGLKAFITASGVNYYGTETTEKIYKESDPPGKDFLGNLCKDWESSAFRFEDWGTRVCAIRTAVVLSPRGGMLKQLLPLAKLNLLSALGDGRQIIPWIHIDDLTDIYIHILENSNLSGAFNAAASQIINSRELTKAIVRASGNKIWAPRVPGFLLKFIFGETASIMLNGSAVSNEKVKNAGFHFQFDTIDKAMGDLIQKSRERDETFRFEM